MRYKIVYRKRAVEEYLSSLLWYKNRSLYAAEQFADSFDVAIKMIAENPERFRNTYKDFYEAQLKKFPFSIVYFIDKLQQSIVITSVFHHKRNPRKKFRDNQ